MASDFETIISDYGWSKRDEAVIKEIASLISDDKDLFLKRFYSFLMGFSEIEVAVGKKGQEEFAQRLKDWFNRVLSGEFDEIYFRELYRVGTVLAKKNLTPHHISAVTSFVRDYMYEILGDRCSSKENRDRLRKSIFKLIDMSVDTISLAFRQEELSFYLSNSKFHKGIINFASGFSLLLDMFLTIFLVLLAIIIGAYTAFEILTLFAEGYNISKKALSILGNMLILWAIVELLEENIKHLKGAKFAIKVFVSVGLAAIVREILIASLAHNYGGLGFMTATLLALGVVHYLLGKSENKIL